MYAPIAEIILENERNDYRFETFACEICGKHEGVTFVPTSQSWDRGRDGRAIGSAKGSHRNILCATLNRDVDSKVDNDLLRVTATSSPDRLVYCSSQRLSEEKLDDVTKIIRRHVASGSVETLGAIQLAKLAEKYSDIFERYYKAEIQAVKESILSNAEGNTPNTRGLRLALITFGSEEGASLRSDILRNSVLDILGDKKGRSIKSIAETFAKDLGLPRSLPPQFLANVLDAEQAAGTVRQVGDTFSITDSGLDQLKSAPQGAAALLLEGHRVIRGELETRIGSKITDIHFSQIWSSLTDFMAGLFYANGLEVIRAVELFLTGEDADTDHHDLRELLASGAKKTASVVATPDLRDRVERAILDIFLERAGAAFDWLTRIAERFVMLCSLGLESESGDELRRVLTSHQIVLDSDIILSYLCEAEPDHIAARDLLSRWIQIGGRLLVSPVVLEEVAHHAWIANRDFQETEFLLGKLKRYELRRYIRSAFVRTYHSLEKTPSRWPLYIGQFRGNAENDYSKILNILRQRLKVDTLPQNYDDKLRGEITEFLMTLVSRNGDSEKFEDIGFKIQRDGKLMASIAAARTAQTRAGATGPIVLLSSANTLRKAEKKFQSAFESENVLLSIAALSYLLARIPDAALGADSLRRALFEFGGGAGLRDAERRALRIIRATGEFDIPWAGRILLQQQLGNSIKSEASKRGVHEEQLRRQLATGAEPKTSARLISEALRNMAVETKAAEELAEANRQIDKLELQVMSLEEAMTKKKR